MSLVAYACGDDACHAVFDGLCIVFAVFCQTIAVAFYGHFPISVAKKSSMEIAVEDLLQVLVNSDTWYMNFLI